MARKRSSPLEMRRELNGNGRHPFEVLDFQGDAVRLVAPVPVEVFTRAAVHTHSPQLSFAVRINDEIRIHRSGQTFRIQRINSTTKEVQMEEVVEVPAVRQAM